MERNLRTGGFSLRDTLAVARAARDAWATIRRTAGSGTELSAGYVGGLEPLEGRQLMAATVLTGAGFGTAGSFANTGNTYDKALDGNVSTYFDSTQATGAVVGVDLGSAKNVTAVQVAPRGGMGWRVPGAKIQGSNTSSTSGFVDLGTITSSPADGQLTTINLTNPGSYRWVRYVAPADSFGNVAEVRFLGDSSTTGGGTTTTDPTTPSQPTAPTTSGQLSGTGFGTAGSWNNAGNTFAKALDGNASTYFDSTQASGAVVGLDLGSATALTSVKFMPRSGFGWRMTGGTFQGSNDNSSWTTLARIGSEPASGQFTTLNLSGTYRYVRYVAPADSFGNVAEVQFFGAGSTGTETGGSTDTGTTTPSTPTTSTTSGQLTGTGFGTAGSFANLGNTYDKALDGNAGTYFDSTQASGAVVGLDLGSATALTSVKFMPRSGFGWRMTGGTFQGSNDNSSWTTLARIGSEPASGQFATLNLSGTYRYVRYVAPADSFGNVAEVQFFGAGGTTSGTDPQSPTPPVVTDPGTPTSNPGPTAPAPGAVITQMQGSVTAGMAVHVNGLASTLNAGSPVTARYEWDFGDPSGKYNKLVGFNAAHVYDTPGTYTVTLKVTNEGGGTSTVTSQVTVKADTRRTIYVDAANGNDANNGTSTSTAVRSAARAFQLLGDNTKVLFARGQTFGVDNFLYATYSNITIGAYGSGANPTLRWQGPAQEWYEVISAGAAGKTSDVTVENLTFDSVSGKPVGVAPRGQNVTVRNCEFRNMSEAINAAGNPTGLVVQDNVQPANSGVADYFLWLQGSDAVVVGNNVGAGSQYAIRTSGGTGETITRALFANNTLSCTDRSNLRVQKGSYCYAVGNTINSSGVEFGPLGGGDGKSDPNWATARTSNVVFENNRVTLGAVKYVRLSNGLEHVAVRNNVIEHDYAGTAIGIEGYDPSYGRNVTDATIANNTIIDNATSGIGIELEGSENGAQLSILNNLFVAPNLAIGSDGNAPVYVDANDLSSFRAIRDNVWSLPGSTNGWAAGGINFVGTSYAYPDYVTPTAWNGMAQVDHDTFSTVPISGNYTPSGVATSYSRSAPGVFTDFYGKARPTSGYWSAGAVQV